MEQGKRRRFIHMSRKSEIKFPNKEIHGKLFRSISPDRRPLAPLFPKPIRLHQRPGNSSNSDLIRRKSGKIKEELQSFDKLSIDKLFSVSFQMNPSKEKRLTVVKRNSPDTRSSLYGKIDSSEVLAIYGIKKRKQLSMDLESKGRFFKGQSKGNIREYTEQIKLRSKKLIEKMQKS